MAMHTKIFEKATRSRYSKFIVLFCILTIIAFTTTCMAFYWNEKEVDPVLIGFFFACFGMEFTSLAFIKRGEYRYVGGDKVGRVERIEEEDGN